MKKFVVLSAVLLLGITSMQSMPRNVEAAAAAIDAVISGQVVELVEFAHLSDEEGLWIATIAVDKVIQDHELISGKTVQVYFLWNGKEKDESPKHVELTKGTKAEFHLDARPLMENKDVFFLDAQSDVKS